MPLNNPTGFAPHSDPAYAPVAACTYCAAELPRSPRPIFRLHPKATIALISQAPGRLAHESGVAWDDPSGRKLREWLGVGEAVFYDSPTFAVTPMGMCYPGKGKGGDLPPRPECAPLWQDQLLKMLPDVRLKILIGAYAQRHHLGKRRERTLTETVRNYEAYLPEFFVLPHPSPRNGIFLRKNPWIEAVVIPQLRLLVNKYVIEGGKA